MPGNYFGDDDLTSQIVTGLSQIGTAAVSGIFGSKPVAPVVTPVQPVQPYSTTGGMSTSTMLLLGAAGLLAVVLIAKKGRR